MTTDPVLKVPLDTKTLALSEVLHLGDFTPAMVQRGFQWHTEEASRLLSDLLAFMRPLGLDVTEQDTGDYGGPPTRNGDRRRQPTARTPRVYYLGQMVLMPRERRENSFLVYDGMQRLSTLMILLSVIRDSWQTPTQADTSAIDGMLSTPDGGHRLFAATPAGAISRIVGRNPNRFSRPKNSSDADHRIHDVQYAFKERVESWGDDQRRQFLDLLCKCVLISVTISEHRPVAYQIFVTANARGKRLELSEVLKGKTAELIDRGRRRGGGEAYAAIWEGRRRQTGRHFDKLLADAELIRCRSVESHHPGQRLIEELESGDEASDPSELAEDFATWIENDLARYVDAFKRIRQHYSLSECLGADITLRRLSFLPWSEWRAVAIMLDEKYERDTAIWAGKLQELERASFCLELADWREPGIREKMIKAIEELAAGQDPFRRGGALYFSPTSRIRAKASAKLDKPLADHEQRGVIVRWLETLYWTNRLPLRCTDDTTVEHVLPQTLKDDWEHSFDEKDHEHWVHRLGNLCLLPKDLNEDLRTSRWSKKQSAYANLEGRHRSAADVGEFRTWTPADVAGRHERVVAMAREALDL